MSKQGWLSVAFLILVSGAAIWHFAVPSGGGGVKTPDPPPAVPVQIGATKAQDVPVDMDGLGTVQALNTVEIKSQVNGTLISIPVKEGQEVKIGDIVAEIDPRPYQAALDQAVAQKAGDQALLRSAQLDLQRYQTLSSTDFASRQQVDDQQAAANKDAASVQADTAAIETAQINLRYCVIRSPINGRVSLYQTDPGNLIEVASSTDILSITQDHPIALVFTLPEDDLPRIQAAMEKGTLPVLAYSSDGTTLLDTGQMETPNNTIDTTTGTIQLKAIFPNLSDRLWPGEFVNAHLQVEVLHQAVTLPVAAVQHGPNGTFVYKLMPDNSVQQQPVSEGYTDGTIMVIASGLSANQKVVLSGQSRLSPGVHVALATTGND